MLFLYFSPLLWVYLLLNLQSGASSSTPQVGCTVPDEVLASSRDADIQVFRRQTNTAMNFTTPPVQCQPACNSTIDTINVCRNLQPSEHRLTTRVPDLRKLHMPLHERERAEHHGLR